MIGCVDPDMTDWWVAALTGRHQAHLLEHCRQIRVVDATLDLAFCKSKDGRAAELDWLARSWSSWSVPQMRVADDPLCGTVIAGCERGDQFDLDIRVSSHETLDETAQLLFAAVDDAERHVFIEHIVREERQQAIDVVRRPVSCPVVDETGLCSGVLGRRHLAHTSVDLVLQLRCSGAHILVDVERA